MNEFTTALTNFQRVQRQAAEREREFVARVRASSRVSVSVTWNITNGRKILEKPGQDIHICLGQHFTSAIYIWGVGKGRIIHTSCKTQLCFCSNKSCGIFVKYQLGNYLVLFELVSLCNVQGYNWIGQGGGSKIEAALWKGNVWSRSRARRSICVCVHEPFVLISWVLI